MFLLIEMEAATPRGLARVLDPGLSTAREAAKAVPLESVRRNENQLFLRLSITPIINPLDTLNKSCIMKNELHSFNTKVLCFNR